VVVVGTLAAVVVAVDSLLSIDCHSLELSLQKLAQVEVEVRDLITAAFQLTFLPQVRLLH
jgi:hypothetical protein